MKDKIGYGLGDTACGFVWQAEGYRTAEVTLGGVDTHELSSRTMEARQVPGLYFIGEVMDVTGWLGGYNFQWAWASAWACAQALAEK
jgi:predicted flavoprotein YhiN